MLDIILSYVMNIYAFFLLFHLSGRLNPKLPQIPPGTQTPNIPSIVLTIHSKPSAIAKLGFVNAAPLTQKPMAGTTSTKCIAGLIQSKPDTVARRGVRSSASFSRLSNKRLMMRQQIKAQMMLARPPSLHHLAYGKSAAQAVSRPAGQGLIGSYTLKNYLPMRPGSKRRRTKAESWIRMEIPSIPIQIRWLYMMRSKSRHRGRTLSVLDALRLIHRYPMLDEACQ
jgi:hypothetical protein